MQTNSQTESVRVELQLSKSFAAKWKANMAEPGQSFEDSLKEYLESDLQAGIEAKKF